MSLLTFSLHLVAFVNNINKINNNIFDNMFLDENLESARGRDVPPAIAVEPLRDLASASASAREALRSWLGGNGGKAKGVDPFEATAYLPPEVVADRSRASEELREQLVLEDKFSLSRPPSRPSRSRGLIQRPNPLTTCTRMSWRWPSLTRSRATLGAQ